MVCINCDLYCRDFASQAISFEILDATSNSGSAAGRNNADEISGKAATHSTGTGTEMEESDPAGTTFKNWRSCC